MTIMGPEVVCQRAFGDWLVARRWEKEFKNSELEGWSMAHSFYANMGGIVLAPKDEDEIERFPINAAQLHFLAKKGYIDHTSIAKKTILDKNKVSGELRLLTLGQTLWFCLNCFARIYQRIPLTTIELSTLAFIIPSIGTLYFWWHKPMDVESYIVIRLDSNTSIAQIREEEGQGDIDWKKTPLEFVHCEKEWPWNKQWYYGLAILEKGMRMKWVTADRDRKPIECIRDDYWPKPTPRSLPVLLFIHLSYAVVLVVGWHLDLPTATELLLWRVACLIQLGTIMSAWLTMPFQIDDRARDKWDRLVKSIKSIFAIEILRRWGRRFSKPFLLPRDKVENIRSLNGDGSDEKTRITLMLLYQSTWLVYLFARTYIIVEDLISLRAMPPEAFSAVNWPEVLPHI